MPYGVWYHFWTDERFEGGKTYQIEADFGKIPVFVKEKTLLPLAKPVESIDQDTVFEVLVHVYGDGPKNFYLYEDDGHSFDYSKGQFSIIRLSIHENGNSEVNRSGKFSKETYKIVGWRKV